MARKKNTQPAVAPPPSPPLPADILTHPRAFGQQLRQAETTSWQYWPALVVTGLLAGIAYALLVRPGLNLAAAEAARAATEKNIPLPGVLTHITNAFGTFFLTVLTFLTMWGLGRLGTGPGPDTRGPKVAEVYSATFALLPPLYLLTTALILLTPASAWALTPQQVTDAGGDALKLQQAAMHNVARTPAFLAFLLTSLLGTLAQFGLAYAALRENVGNRAIPAVLLPLLPALLIQFIGIASLLFAR